MFVVEKKASRGPDGDDGPTGEEGDAASQPKPAPAAAVLHRFHASVSIDPVRANKDIADIVDNVVQHLVGQGDVQLRLEIQADLPDGAPDDVVRTVNENAKVLKFDSFGFEEE